MDMAIQRVQDYPKASIIVQLPCLPGDEHLDAQTTRPLTTHDISVLTELQVLSTCHYIPYSWKYCTFSEIFGERVHNNVFTILILIIIIN